MESIRILGMMIKSSGSNNQTVLRLTKKTDNAVRLLTRVANWQQGLGEGNLVKLVHAFVMCYFTYIAAMHNWQRSERDKLNALIRKAKRALSLPIYTQMECLLQLGMHNTLEELRKRKRGLSSSDYLPRKLEETFYRIWALPPQISKPSPAASLKSSGTTSLLPQASEASIRSTTWEDVVHAQRPRCKWLANGPLRTVSSTWCATLTDKLFVAVGVDHEGQVKNFILIQTTSSEIAEQAATAMALLDVKRTTIYSDNQRNHIEPYCQRNHIEAPEGLLREGSLTT